LAVFILDPGKCNRRNHAHRHRLRLQILHQTQGKRAPGVDMR
jgi:hypothetical protein